MRTRGFSAALTAVTLIGAASAVFVFHPRTPLPDHWNPVLPLEIDAPATLVTDWKLRRTAAREETCLAALPTASIVPLPPLEVSEQCGIDPRVRMSRAGRAVLEPTETTCAIALRVAMWERHTLQPAARRIFGADVSRIRHFSSYSCRQIRTPGGDAGRMSTHATAEAIDIAGFDLSNGRQISLLRDWGGSPKVAEFLRAARDGACRWFQTTLGPEFNALHADHFHLQSRGWGTCR